VSEHDPIPRRCGAVPVRATVVTLDGFLAHADRDEILRWLAGCRRAPRQVYVVHGEPRPPTRSRRPSVRGSVGTRPSPRTGRSSRCCRERVRSGSGLDGDLGTSIAPLAALPRRDRADRRRGSHHLAASHVDGVSREGSETGEEASDQHDVHRTVLLAPRAEQRSCRQWFVRPHANRTPEKIGPRLSRMWEETACGPRAGDGDSVHVDRPGSACRLLRFEYDVERS